MYADDENEDDRNNRKGLELKLQRFLNQSQLYFDRLPSLKAQLNDIDQLKETDSYIQKLNDIGTIVHDLAKNIHSIEELHSQLNENERLKLDHQVQLLRIEIDREMSELHKLREQSPVSSPPENQEPHQNNIDDDTTTTNELRQRHVTTNRLNDSYDLLEHDLASLREAIDEVATLVAQQEQTLSKTEQFKTIAHSHARDVSSFFQKAVHNRYVAMASGAILGASIGGPVGLMMGTKIGALVACTGSALGALSMNIMRQRAVEDGDLQDDSTAYNQAML